MLELLAEDVRYALRALWRARAFTAIAVLTLAIGIGVNTAIFSVVNAVVLRPLPYRDPSSLVLVDTSPLAPAGDALRAAWRERAHSLSDMAGFDGPRPATLVHNGTPRQIDSALVTPNLLSFLGAAPALGRDLVPSDADPGSPAVALFSETFWRTAFGGDPAVLGQTTTISGSPVTIVGIAPAGFRFPAGGALPATGLPLKTQPDVFMAARTTAALNVVGRLAPGRTAAAATSELLAIFKQDTATSFSRRLVDRLELHAVPLQERLVGGVRDRLWLVMGAVGFVLLVACANVANLLVARASSRQRELAVRMALGARRGRIARLLLAESLLLALAGSVLALVLAAATMGTARALLANRVPHVDAITLDGFVLAFNAAVAILSGVVCGLISLPGLGRMNAAAISDSGAHAVTGRNRIRRLLLSAETATTFVLFVGAALFARTLWNLTVQDNGFQADRVLTVRVNPGLPQELDRRDHRAGSRYFAGFFGDLRLRLERIDGVTAAGAISLVPLEGVSSGFGGVTVDGRQAPATEAMTPVAFVTPGYFPAMRTPIVQGRDFDDRDRMETTLVAIVNEAFARRYATGGPILGARVTSGSGPETFTVVGVARDTPLRSLRDTPEPLLVAPLAQMPAVHITWGALTFVLRTDGRDPMRLADGARRTIWSVDPNIVISDVASMNDRVAVSMRTEHDSALLFGLLALTALVMAAVGVYGVAAYSVAQRTREIGIRVALGAARGDVRRLVVRQAVWPTAWGIALGVVVAAQLTRLVSSMVYGVTPLDPATFAAGGIVLVAVAVAATWMPATRATRIDPLVAIRAE